MKKHTIRIIVIVVVLLLLIGGAVALVEYRVKSVRSELSVFAANSIASEAANDGIDAALADYKVNYDDIVSFTYDENGSIKSISTNIIVLNNLGNEIDREIDLRINEISAHKLKIPLSTLLGGELTSGIGPKISIHITMSGVTITKFENNFESAGVNQTRHQIMLNVTVNSYVISGGKVDVIPYNSNICIAESIIVGITPQTFAEISR